MKILGRTISSHCCFQSIKFLSIQNNFCCSWKELNKK
jgi:hypothetical protein